MEQKDFHKLTNNMHILGIISMYGRYQQVLHDKSKLTPTPEIIEDLQFLQNGLNQLEMIFERKIVEIIKKHTTPQQG